MLDLKDKKILIAGLGLSGKAALEVLSKTGAIISVYDERDIEWDDPRLYKKLEITEIAMYLNGMEVPDESWDIIVLSPGIPMDSDFIISAKKHDTKIIGELELAYELSPGMFVAITGTNGKTTTTTLVGEIFKNSGADTVVGGNIGSPVISSAGDANENTVMVTEVSSFQLESVDKFKPHVSAVLNLTPDHMDRHKTMENYGAAKARIFENQDRNDFLIYNHDDAIVNSLVNNTNAQKIPFSRISELEIGAFVKGGNIVIRDLEGNSFDIIEASRLNIPGDHNMENALAASAITFFAGVDKDTIAETLEDFKGVPHRLELVSTRRGIRFVNDSKGTNPDASKKAIDAVGNGIFLIAGGYDKNSDFHDFIENFGGRVKHLLLIGETAQRFKDTAMELGFTNVQICSSMAESVRLGYEYAEEGDTVLLSPASASWDMYNNFEERGDHFRKVVEELK